MGRKTVTFRSQTISSIGDLIEDEGLSCHASQNLLAVLAGELLKYRDEGVELAPVTMFCTNSEGVFQTFPGTVKHTVGEAPLHADSIKRVLKDCAPLATRSWSIFIERLDADRLQYGVFNYVTLPTTLPLSEAIGLAAAETCLLLRKTGLSTVEVRGAKGNELALIFSTTREDNPPESPVSEFARDCCRDIPASPTSEEFKIYFARLLEEGLSRCHGTMLACAANPSLAAMEEMKDGVEIFPKLDFLSAYNTYRSDESAESILKLQSSEELLNGILQCDGILMFNTCGSLMAYRVFYRPAGQSNATVTPPTSGGARTRAFEGVKTLVGSTLLAALFRSQDGLTIRAGGA